MAQKEIVHDDNSKIDPPVLSCVTDIFSAANENIGRTFTGNLDQLSQDQIDEAIAVLNDLSKEAGDGFALDYYNRDVKDKFVPIAERYYNLIPTNLGHKIDPVDITIKLIREASQEEDRLQALKAALTSNKIRVQGGSILDQLGATLTLLNPIDSAYIQIRDYIKTTSRQSLSRLEVFEVSIPSERARFEKEQRGASKIKLLVHGTMKPNLRHILRSGLIVPRIASNGRAFGDGIYFADETQKSLNYNGGSGYLFFADVKLGNYYVTGSTNSWRGHGDIPKGYDSLYAPGQKPIEGIHRGSLTWAEYVVYLESQQTIRYLARFK